MTTKKEITSIDHATSPAIEKTTNNPLSKNFSAPNTVNGHQIEKVLQILLNDLRSIQKTYQIVMPHVITWLNDQRKKSINKLDSYALEADTEGKNFYTTSDVHSTSELLATLREMENLGGIKIPETLQRSLFTQIFCEFDSFIGALLKTIYTNKADLLKSIAREITFSDLLNYENLNAIKLDMLNKEVESFRRESYVEQFSILENKFGLKTLRAFDEWGEFVELSQRRNLLVHNGGVVSEQYLLVCDREGYKFDKRPLLGETLKPTPAYFGRAIVVISKVAFMLSHTLWRKIFPNDILALQTSTNNTLYELLKDKRWKTSSEIAKFCLSDKMKLNISDIDLRIRIVNAAIAAKFSGSPDIAKSYLQSIDWSASYRDFKLAITVLHEEFIEAAAIMKIIGKNGELLDQLSYHEWPLFHKFRDTPEFLNAYQEIYQVSFIKEDVRQSTEKAQQDEIKLDATIQIEEISNKKICDAEPEQSEFNAEKLIDIKIPSN